MADSPTPRCTTITPIIFVKNLKAAIHFYSHYLQFNVGTSMEGYAYIVRDDIAIRLIQAESSVSGSSSGEQSCYICVNRIDELYQQLEPNLSQLPEGRVKAPFDQPYGQREFHVTDKDSMLIFFGEAISA